jgi:hypothetical protein
MPFVQKLEFIIRRKDLEEILADESNVALRITLGVNEKAKLVITADGVARIEQSEEVMANIPICPVPPDCDEDDNGTD